jgi:hypothetical protein
MAKKPKAVPLSNDELRTIILNYFYERNKNATSIRGAKGASAKISDVRADLKKNHGLTQQEVVSNLTYLISHGWVAEERIIKNVSLPRGTVIPQATAFYAITARGIDKIEGTSEFTMQKFHDIKIEATGQNIITVGDGNQVNVKYQKAAGALAQFREAVVASDIPENAKLDLVADVETIQSQLAKAQPSKGVIREAWESIKAIAVAVGLTADLTHLHAVHLLPLWQ